MAAPSPSLSISDLMYPFSPPPQSLTASKPSSPLARPKSPTPEPLEPVEIEEMRRKVVAMGWADSSKGKEKAGSREDELAMMLLRLTHPASLPQPSQLHAQAETISNLIQQRNFLVQRNTEERERWESEREGWTRAAQALILQNRRDAAHWETHDSMTAQYTHVTPDMTTQRLHECERINAVLQSEKKMLQQKLVETQNRLANLESEIAQLRPLLLMQPFALMHSHPVSASHGWTASLPNLSTQSRRRREENPPEEDLDSEEDQSVSYPQPRLQFREPLLRPIGHDPPSAPGSPQRPVKGDYYRRRDITAGAFSPTKNAGTKTPFRKGGSASTTSHAPLLSDARTEHLLLAARKIGMQRATVLTGAFSHLQQLTSAPSTTKPEPSSPQKTSGKRGGPSSPSKTPKTPRRSQVPITPLLTRTPLNFTNTAGSSTAHGTPAQRTPLQSLLSAAQSVLSAPPGSSRNRVGIGLPDSPLAKKRKLDHNSAVLRGALEGPSKKSKGKEVNKGVNDESGIGEEGDLTPKGINRAKSALDFLADQAAAYSSHSQAPSQASVEIEDGDGDGDEDGDTGGLGQGHNQQQVHGAEDNGEEDAEGEDETVDVEMVGATLEDMERDNEKAREEAVPTRRSNRIRAKGKQREKSDAAPLLASTVMEVDDVEDDGETDTQIQRQTQTQTESPESQSVVKLERRSRATTPTASQGGTFSEPSQRSSQPQKDSAHQVTPLMSTPPNPLSELLMLAPPINLSPRMSRSPAPISTQTHAQAPSSSSRIRSRSHSSERPSHSIDNPSSSNPNPSGSFNMFSVQRPQPLTAGSSLLQHGNSQSMLEEQGPSMLLTSRIDGVKFIAEDPPHRTRSPYVKWTKEEDELLAKAVAKYGQKWDLVQKELPSRGYHQVRQRWLRKLGVLDSSKLDLSSIETNSAADFLQLSTAPATDTEKSPEPSEGTGVIVEHPKLELAPLSSEKIQGTSSTTSVSGSTSGAGNGNRTGELISSVDSASASVEES